MIVNVLRLLKSISKLQLFKMQASYAKSHGKLLFINEIKKITWQLNDPKPWNWCQYWHAIHKMILCTGTEIKNSFKCIDICWDLINIFFWRGYEKLITDLVDNLYFYNL